MIVDMKAVTNSKILSGAIQGRTVYAALVTATANEPASAELVFLDFSDVEIATASFLREAVLAFRDSIRSKSSMYYPVIANANEAIKEEMQELLRGRGKAYMACDLSNHKVSNQNLLGELDPKQKLAFQLVQERRETDATELIREDTENKTPTVWNNRLSALVDLGLIIELRDGRSKRYKTLFEKGI